MVPRQIPLGEIADAIWRLTVGAAGGMLCRRALGLWRCFVVSALVEWTSFLLTLPWLGPTAAAFVGFLVATGVNFALSRKVAFRSVRSARTELLLVLMMSAAAFAMNFAAFLLLFRFAGLDVFVAKMGGTGFGFTFNYLARQFLVFSRFPRFGTVSALFGKPRDRANAAPHSQTLAGSEKSLIPLGETWQGPMMKTTQAPYAGHRILEAMHSAPHYADAILCAIRAAMPCGATRILDFGAGDAAFLDKFRAIGIAVDCVEPDERLQALLRSKTPRVFSDIAEIDTGTYDFVYTVNVLEHINAVDDSCAQLHRILRPGGRLFVFVPAFEVLWTSLDDEVGHVRRFSKQGLRGTLTAVGFSVEQLRFFDSLGFPALLGVRLLEGLNLFRYDGGSVGFYDRYLFPISQGLDRAVRGVIGKNLVAVAYKAERVF